MFGVEAAGSMTLSSFVWASGGGSKDLLGLLWLRKIIAPSVSLLATTCVALMRLNPGGLRYARPSRNTVPRAAISSSRIKKGQPLVQMALEWRLVSLHPTAPLSPYDESTDLPLGLHKVKGKNGLFFLPPS